jgi:hypothetical protein
MVEIIILFDVGRQLRQAVTISSGDYIEYVSGRAEFRPIARTTPTLILEYGGGRPAQSLCEHRRSCRLTAACRSLLALVNFRFGAHYELKSDIASGPKCAATSGLMQRSNAEATPQAS